MSFANEDKAAHVPPSQDPEKKEVLVISGIQIKERKKEVRLFEIRRDNNGKVTNLQEFPPEEKKEGSVDVPLLDAFIDGFKTAYLTRYN